MVSFMNEKNKCKGDRRHLQFIALFTIFMLMVACGDGGGDASITTIIGEKQFVISWQPPSKKVDGSDLTDLAGYRIYYGTRLGPGGYSQWVDVESALATSHLIENLATGTYYVAIVAVDSSGNESRFSNIVSVTL